MCFLAGLVLLAKPIEQTQQVEPNKIIFSLKAFGN